jgi:hypothetical protein
MRYTTRPLDASTWDSFAELVERNNGIYGGCWCVAFHSPGTTGTPSMSCGNCRMVSMSLLRIELFSTTKPAPGTTAFRPCTSTAVGWPHVARPSRTACPRLRSPWKATPPITIPPPRPSLSM